MGSTRAGTLARVQELKDAGQDFEWYPTTPEIMEAMKKDMEDDGLFKSYSPSSHGNPHLPIGYSILDCGAGDGRVLDYFKDSFKRKYAIEKAKVHLDSLDKDIFIVGTDFNQQTLMDKSVHVIFSNPPYLEYEDWATKIIYEANAATIYLVIPSRWQDSDKIKQMLEARDPKICRLTYTERRDIRKRQSEGDEHAIEYVDMCKVVGSFDFLTADRQARAKVDLVRIKLREYDNQNLTPKIDPFDVWFKEHFDIKTNATNKTMNDLENELKASVDETLTNANRVAENKGVVKILEDDYQLKLVTLLDTYKQISKMDSALLKALDVNVKSIKEAMKLKVTSLKDVYWIKLFDNFDGVTKRLTSGSRKKLFDTLVANTHVDFTSENAHGVVLWVIKNSNSYFDSQLLETYDAMTKAANVELYKSNQRVFKEDRWGNLEPVHKDSGDLSHYKLTYRIVASGGGLDDSQYSYYAINGLSLSAHTQLNNLCTVATNLGFDTENQENSEAKEWGRNKLIKFYFQNHTTDMQEVLFEARAYYKGTTHLKFNTEFMDRMNVECGRLRGWIKTPKDVVDEVGIKLNKSTTMDKIEGWFKNTNFRVTGTSALPALGFVQNGIGANELDELPELPDDIYDDTNEDLAQQDPNVIEHDTDESTNTEEVMNTESEEDKAEDTTIVDIVTKVNVSDEISTVNPVVKNIVHEVDLSSTIPDGPRELNLAWDHVRPVFESFADEDKTLVLKRYSDAYAAGNPLISDPQYDELEALSPNPVVEAVGLNTSGGKSSKVELPFNSALMSLTQIKEPAAWIRWIDPDKTYIVADKLDGVSGGAHAATQTAYTRGTGDDGLNITPILEALGIPLTGYSKDVRGEIICKDTVFTENRGHYYFMNPRSMVSGILTRVQSGSLDEICELRTSGVTPEELAERQGLPHPTARDLLALCEFVVFNHIDDDKKLSKALKAMSKHGFNVVNHTKVSGEDITPEWLLGEYKSRIEASEYGLDGLVITEDCKQPKLLTKNPEHAMKYKPQLAKHKRVELTDIIFEESRHGRLTPVGIFDPVDLEGAMCTNVTLHNFKMVEKESLNIGSVVDVVRSGKVIPYLVKVVTPSEAPFKPDIKCEWDGVHLVVKELSDTQKIKRLSYFLQTIGVDGIQDDTMSLLYNAGYTTLKSLCKAKVKKLAKVDGFGETSAESLLRQLNARKVGLNFVSAIVATGALGTGFGQALVTTLVDKLEFNVGHAELPKEALSGLDKFGPKRIDDFIENQPALIKEIAKLAKLGFTFEIPPAIVVEDTQVSTALEGRHFTFTGVRSPDAELTIKQHGGTVGGISGKTTDLVHDPDKPNNKTAAFTKTMLTLDELQELFDDIDPTSAIERQHSEDLADHEKDVLKGMLA